MLRFGVIVLVAALIAIFLGVGGVPLGTKILFFIFLAFAVLAFVSKRDVV
jgi:uncharacterized membrane protein YtjA (UPF0391 family)